MNDAWKNQTVLIVGMARSGIASARLLCQMGARVILSDIRNDIEGIEELIALGCVARLGEPSECLLDGCDSVIVSPVIPKNAPVVVQAEKRGIDVLSELELAARFVRGTQLAITGTNGKTTTSMLTGEMLRNAGKSAYVAGNVGLALSSVALQTKPDDYTVIEVSSFQLEHMGQFHPYGAAILNLTPDHLDRHGTMETYGELKEHMLQNQNKGDFFVYNADDAFCREVAGRAAARAVPFSRIQTLKSGAWVQEGQIIVAGRALCEVDALSLPGPHNLENALAAAAIAAELSVPAPVIRHTLRTFVGVPHRMEWVRELDGVRYINDSKGTNPDSAIRAVQSMMMPTVLIAGGEDKHMSYEGFAQAICENKNIRHVILIGRMAETIREALALQGYTACTMAGWDFEKAIDLARRASVPGGTVLLSPACASFDMFHDFEERGNRFKEIVHALEDGPSA